MRSVIICVDDDSTILQKLSDQLNEWLGTNYKIEKALSGDEAIKIIKEYKDKQIDVSVVISDYFIPNMKGDELLERVKRINTSIRKIMMSEDSCFEGLVNAVNKAGLYKFAAKPWDEKDFMIMVMEAVKSFEQEKYSEQVIKKLREKAEEF